MILKSMLEGLDYSVLQGSDEIDVTELVYDSRKVSEGCVFVCIAGAVRDAHDFIPEVIAAGAAAVIVEKDVNAEGVTLIRTESTRKALGFMSAAWFGHPADKLKTIGITGTKGKTTTT